MDAKPKNFADGPYKDLIYLFIEYKRGKGEKCRNTLTSACSVIASILSGETNAAGLSEETVRRVLCRIGDESDHVREYRVSTMRQFCAFLNTLGIPCWQVPPRYFTAPRSEFRPYILSDKDITLLFKAADSLPPKPRAKDYELIYPVLVRLLLSTGLRISEALALVVDDFNKDTDVLRVINSKNGVSRIVPLDPGMAVRLNGFLNLTKRNTGPIFKSPFTQDAYNYETVRCVFKRLYDMAGITNEYGRRPRIHDLRHTFCTKSLDKMLATGMDVYEAIPILAAYVGHVNYTDTERYIHLTRASHEAFLASETALGDLIPKVVK